VAIGANLGGQIIARRGYVRELAAAGLAVTTGVIAYYGTIGPETRVMFIVAAALALGIGVSFGFTAFTVPVQNAMPEARLGIVTTSLQFARVLGMSVSSAGLGALLLAQLNTGGAVAGGPREQLADPEVLVSASRLAEVREEFRADPSLGEEAYADALAESRQDLNSAVQTVYRAAAVVSGLGVLIAVFTFSGSAFKGRGGRRETSQKRPAG
jgi:hypothetical protein